MMAVSKKVVTRPATEVDLPFIESSYLSTQKPHLKELPDFDEGRLIQRFRKTLALGDVEIIVRNGDDIGWVQLTMTTDMIEIAQLHLAPAYQNMKIGSTIIQDVLDEASSSGRMVKLAVLKGNRAVLLYERLGFEVRDEDDIKYYMRWPRERPVR